MAVIVRAVEGVARCGGEWLTPVETEPQEGAVGLPRNRRAGEGLGLVGYLVVKSKSYFSRAQRASRTGFHAADEDPKISTLGWFSEQSAGGEDVHDKKEC